MSSDVDLQIPDDSGRLNRAYVHIRNHNEHPSLSHVLLLITFTPNPQLIIVSDTSLPLIITITASLFVSTTVGPSLGFVKYVGVVVGFVGASADLRPLMNRGTNCSNRPSGNMIWHCVNVCHDGSSSMMGPPLQCHR